MTIGLILARGGSKGLPGKNKKELNGKPLIGYAIEAAQKSTLLGEIFVSSDDPEIILIAEQYGVNSIGRPASLASDTATSVDAARHAVMEIEKRTGKITHLLLINACCPLTTPEDIDNIIQIAKHNTCDSVVSLVEDFSSHPSKVCELDKKGRVVALGFETHNRQHLPKTYKRNTALYLVRKDVLMETGFFGDDIRGYIMPKIRSYDINDQIDFDICEFLIKKNGNNR